MRKLTSLEVQKPYAEYYYKRATPVEVYEMDKIRKPMDPAMAIYPKDIDMLLSEDRLEIETGWCVLPDGAGYVSVRNEMPGVTLDMMSWWFAWHGFEDLRYMLWYPPCHFGVEIISGKDRILDEKVPLREKMYGVVHRVREDVSGKGNDTEKGFDIHFRSPAEMGFSRKKLSNRYYIVGAFPDLGKDISSTGKPAIMCHVFQETESGVVMRTRFWMGWGIENGRAACYINSGFSMPEAVPADLARHSIEEFTNLKHILPGLYEKYGRDDLC